MNQHFATMEGDALAAEMVERFNRFTSDLRQCEDLYRMRLGFLALYGEDDNGGRSYETQRTGKDGQARKLKSNQLRVHLLQRIGLATSELPDMQPTPTNTDASSMAQSQLGKGLLDYCRKEKHLESIAIETMLIGETMLWAWLDTAWDETAGEEVETVPAAVGEDGGVTGTATTYAGDVEYRPVLPVDCAFDMRRRDGEVPWVIIRRWKNKYDVAAAFVKAGGDPATAQDITSLTGATAQEGLNDFSFVFGPWATEAPRDDIEVLELRHMPCPSAPLGRRALLVGGRYFLYGATLAEGPLDQKGRAKDLRCYRYDAGRRIGSPRGYSSVADVIGTQTAIDTLTSVPYTNQRGLGGNVLWTPEGSGLSHNQLSEALAHVTTKSAQHKPEVLQLLSTSPEVFEFRQTLINELATSLGANSVSMGTEQKPLSGAAAALKDSVAQRAVSAPAQAVVRLLQQACSATLRLFRQNAAAQRTVALIIGKAKAPMMKTFSGEDLGDLESVSVESTSALMKMPSGRLEVGTQLLNHANADGAPLVTAEQFLAVVNTGKLEPLTEAPMNEIIRIRQENERLAAGEVLDTPPPTPEEMAAIQAGQMSPPQVMVTAALTDNHPQHMREHADQARASEDPVVKANCHAHMRAHEMLWYQVSPSWLVALKIPPPPPTPEQMALMAQQQAAASGQASGGEPPKGARSGAGGAEAPELPSMPTNPSTGEEYTPTGDVNATG